MRDELLQVREEDTILLLECWQREYDAKSGQYRVHMQKLADFFYICPQYGQIVRKGKGRDNRPHQSQRENYDRQEGGKFQAAGEPEREAAGQHTNQHLSLIHI